MRHYQQKLAKKYMRRWAFIKKYRYWNDKLIKQLLNHQKLSLVPPFIISNKSIIKEQSRE